MIGLRDPVTVLEPQTTADPYTGEESVDWTQPPVEHPAYAAVQPLSSTEAVLTAGTVISRWRAVLPPYVALDPSWRIRWEGSDYDIDGAVELHKLGPRLHHQSVTLKLVTD